MWHHLVSGEAGLQRNVPWQIGLEGGGGPGATRYVLQPVEQPQEKKRTEKLTGLKTVLQEMQGCARTRPPPAARPASMRGQAIAH